MSGFGVYVHWPFCAAKCPYCDFNSHVRTRYDEMRWAAAIVRELSAVADLQSSSLSSPLVGEGGPKDREGGIAEGTNENSSRPTVTSIFFGGGTPSLMSGQAVGAVLDGVARLWPVAPDAEITLEANPNSVEQSRFRDYRSAGVNRISIGVQSFDDAALKSLGRLHGADEAKAAIRLALSIFPRINFDLIYARPEQTLEAWAAELREALSFGTEHLSVYQLTIEPGTAYATLARQGRLPLPDEEMAAYFFEMTEEICASAGLPAYEISNHARPGTESRHNLIYWRYEDYAGGGPGAHGRLTVSQRRLATQAERLPERWLGAVEEATSSLTITTVPHRDAAREHLLMNLRLVEGLDLVAYRARWGISPSSQRIASLVEAGLLNLNQTRLTATPRGRLVLNALIAELATTLESETALA